MGSQAKFDFFRKGPSTNHRPPTTHHAKKFLKFSELVVWRFSKTVICCALALLLLLLLEGQQRLSRMHLLLLLLLLLPGTPMQLKFLLSIAWAGVADVCNNKVVRHTQLQLLLMLTDVRCCRCCCFCCSCLQPAAGTAVFSCRTISKKERPGLERRTPLGAWLLHKFGKR